MNIDLGVGCVSDRVTHQPRFINNIQSQKKYYKHNNSEQSFPD